MAARRATFTRFDECTKEDMGIIIETMKSFRAAQPDRILAHLKELEGDYGGFGVDRLEHSLQTATLALRDGKDEDYIICCLLHDVGDLLGCFDHGAVATAILKPFTSEANLWMLENHTFFQEYYYAEHLGKDRNAREQFKDHPYYEHTLEFIEKYDMPAFQPDFDTIPLSEFEPMLRRVINK